MVDGQKISGIPALIGRHAPWLAGGGVLIAAMAFGSMISGSSRAEAPVAAPPPAFTVPAGPAGKSEKAVLAGGCFWGIQAVFQHVKGVENAVSGYAGGKQSTASYEMVSTGETGHAEAVEITFDPGVVSYGTILQVYFSVAHDPTQLDRQAPDVGTQYRSEIFVESDSQRQVAEAYVAQLDGAKVFDRPIVTKIERLQAFFPAEAYHQDYATLHPDSGYIAYYDLPKVDNLSRLLPDVYRSNPRLVSEASVSN